MELTKAKGRMREDGKGLSVVDAPAVSVTKFKSECDRSMRPPTQPAEISYRMRVRLAERSRSFGQGEGEELSLESMGMELATQGCAV